MRGLVPIAGPRAFAGALSAVLSVLLIASCSDDSKTPECVNCEAWTQVVDDLGRYPDSHPSDPNFLVYSTIRKTVGAPDEFFESDEDIWLLWRGSDDPSQWVRWQLTADPTVASGDNLQARWSPSGTQIAYVHTDPGGVFEIWRLGVTLPPGNPPSAEFDPRGIPERIVSNGRDPGWETETAVLFSRDAKLFRVMLAGLARGGETVTQITFDPPGFVVADDFIDRHPFAALDGPIVFDTTNREPITDLVVGAFAISQDSPPETTATVALLSLQSPGDATPIYPLMDGPDTLFTTGNDSDPYIRLRSLPVLGGATYTIGARRDSQVFPVQEEVYCDSLIAKDVELVEGEIDTLNLYFEVARGTLIVTSGEIATSVFWTREDGLDTGTADLGLACETRSFNCVLSGQVDGSGNVIPGTLEPFDIIGTSFKQVDSIRVFVPPGETTFVKLFCPDDNCGCSPPAPARPRPGRAARALRAGRGDANVSGVSGIRADGESAIWNLDLSDSAFPRFKPILSSESSLQAPVLSQAFGGGERFLVYSSNETGFWGLFVQKLDASLTPVGGPIEVQNPGTFDNYICERGVFHPSIVAGSAPGNLRILVTMTDCPDNGFEDFGIDDDPWSQGELHVWEVFVPVQ